MTYWLAWEEPRAVGDLVHVEKFFAGSLGGIIHARTRVPGRLGKATSRTSSMYVDEKSDGVIVPEKRPNKEGSPSAEAVEGRTPPKGNGDETAAARTLRRDNASNGLIAVRRAARQSKSVPLTALLHHITIDLLKRSYLSLERDSAPGIDGVTWQTYGENLEEKLEDLHDKVHRGSYRARPARRTYIPKADGSKRPLSILCLEDKVVQQAVATVLEAIYEEDFLGFSYGFRPGRGQHDALDALHAGILRKQVNWVLDADIRGFFDAMAHSWIIRFLEHRIADKRILRLIAKWLKVGTVEDGRRTRGVCGAPQGAVISPILANVYLHYVFDLWVHRWRLTKASGDMIVIRYADDTIVGFQHEHEARAFLDDLKERMRKFELALHPDKTRLIRFGRHATKQREKLGEGKPETFDFLGFTHFPSVPMIMRHLSPKSLASGRRTEITWLCQTETRSWMVVPQGLAQRSASGLPLRQPLRRQLPNCRIGRAVGRSPCRTSCGFWRRSIAPPLAAPAQSCAGKVCTRRP